MPEIPRILLIEDDEGHTELIRYAFGQASEPYSIRFATTIKEGLAVCQAFNPQLVVSDFSLPDGTGIDLLKQMTTNSPVPVVIMTSNGSELVAVDVMKAGAHDYIVKSAGTLSSLPKMCSMFLREWTHKEQNRLAQQELNIWMEIFRNAEWGIAFHKADRGFLDTINPAYARLHGYTIDELRGMPIEQVYAPEFRDQIHEYVSQVNAHGHHTYESVHQRKDGSTFPVLVDVTVLTDAAGKPKYRIVNIQDITARKKAEEEQTNLREQLVQAQKMEVIGRLAGGIAHDFNNIITGIIGYATLTRMHPADTATLIDYMAHVEELGNKAADLTRRLLAFSRKQPLDLQRLDVNELLRATDKIMSRIIRADIAWEISLAPEPIPVKADERQLEQVLLNLITNASDAMPAGGALTVRVSTCTIDQDLRATPVAIKPGNYAVISVTDTGTGIAPEYLAQVFEPFFTTKEVGKGTGLGLAMVYGIIKEHGGGIELESTPQEGTTIRLYLPLLSLTASEPLSPLPAAIMHGNETILVGEDDDNVRSVMRYTLEEFGYSVIEAVNGDETVRKYQANREAIDLVIIDAIMPNKGGIAACREIRAICPTSRIIIMSGYSSKYLNDELSGTCTFINKPVRPSVLLHKVRERLNEHH